MRVGGAVYEVASLARASSAAGRKPSSFELLISRTFLGVCKVDVAISCSIESPQTSSECTSLSARMKRILLVLVGP